MSEHKDFHQAWAQSLVEHPQADEMPVEVEAQLRSMGYMNSPGAVKIAKELWARLNELNRILSDVPEPEVMTDDEAGAILTEIACSLLDAMEAEPAPDEFATRPMPAITPEELEPESTPNYDVPDSSDRGDEYAPEDWYRDEDGEWYEYDCEDLGIDCDDGDYDEPDVEPVPTDLPPSLLPPSAVTPVTVDYFEAQDKLLAADATGWEPRHLKHLPLLIQVTDVNLTADLLIAALTAQVEEIPF